MAYTPPVARILAPDQAEFDQALAILDPADHAALLELGEKPETPFSLIRPFVKPGPEVMDVVQYSLGMVLRDAASTANWTNAAVKKSEYTGATFFDGEPVAIAIGDVFKKITPFALAVKKCAALPESAKRPVSANIARFTTGNPLKRRIYIGLGMLSGDKALLQEYNAADACGHEYLFDSGRVRARLASARLAYILEEKPEGRRSSFVPAVAMKRYVEDFIPERTPLVLDRVRLVVHSNGSPYDTLK